MPREACQTRKVSIVGNNSMYYNSFEILEEMDNDICDNESERIHCRNTIEELCNEISRLKNVILIKDEIHEQEIMKECNQMKYCQGESQARKENVESQENELCQVKDEV